MAMKGWWRPAIRGLTLLLAAFLLLPTGTGGVGAHIDPSSSSVNPAYEDLLPASIRQGQPLRIGADASTPPYLFVDENGDLQGMELDFMRAIGDELGVRIEVMATSFSGLVPSLLSGRIHVGMSNFSDTLERQKQVDFVDYTLSADRLLVGQGNPHRIGSTDELCGLRVSATQGTTSAAGTAALSDECVARGERPITVLLTPSLGDTMIQVQSGRADAMVTDQAQVTYQQTVTDGQVVPAGDRTGPNYHGVATTKGNADLRDALRLVFRELMANGTYDRILTEWGQTDLAIDEPIINGAGRLS